MLEPVEYFAKYFSAEMINLKVDESNRFAVFEKQKALNTTFDEQLMVHGMLIKMGIVNMPRYEMYWSNDYRLDGIAKLMSRNRFYDLLSALHFTDNNKLVTRRDDPSYDRFAKIRPLTKMLKANCQKIVSGQNQCVDEQVIKFKGKHGLKQYIPNKPTKRGFKVFSRNAPDGFMHDFHMYDAKDLDLEKSCGYFPGDVVIKLTQNLDRGKGYIFYYDNYFNFPELQEKLLSDGIYSCGTIRKDRLRNCPTKSDREMRQIGRGTCECHTDTASNVSILQWFDNKSVYLASNFAGALPTDEVERFDEKLKTKIKINRPDAVKLYNECMGGTDLFDMISALYRLDHKSKKVIHFVIKISKYLQRDVSL